MKVLHLSSEATWRGGEQQIAYLLKELSILGVTSFVAVKKNSAFEDYCHHNNIKIFSLPFQNSFDIRTAWAIMNICRNYTIDIVHLHSSKSHSIGISSAIMGNIVPLVLSRRVDFVPKNSWLTKWKYNHFSIRKILCVSDKINEIMRSYVKSSNKCITVHSGIDLSKFYNNYPALRIRHEFNIDNHVKIIGNTSALEAHKDYYTFIDTIEQLIQMNKPIKALIMGKGSLEKLLKEYVNAKGLSEAIIFTGFRNDISDILPSLDLFLMTSSEEGLGTSILDAFAAGVPVVATEVGGIPEMVIHEQTGLLAPQGRSELLAKNVNRLMEDRFLREHVVSTAKEKVKEFSKEATARKTLDVYQEVLSQTGIDTA